MKTLLRLALTIVLMVSSAITINAANDDDESFYRPNSLATRTVSGSCPLSTASFFAYAGSKPLHIELLRGNVVFEEWDKNEISYTAEIRTWANTKKNAEVINSGIDITLATEKGFGVNFKTIFDSKCYSKMDDNGGQGISYEVNMTVKVPRDVFIRVKSDGARINFNMPISRLDAKAEFGTITAKQIAGKADIDTKYTEITIDQIDGDLGIESRNSNITIGKAGGAVGINSSYGKITIKEAKDASISAKYGNLEINKINELKVSEISYGGCTIGELTKTLVIENIKYSALKVHFAGSTEYADVNASYTDVAMTINETKEVISFEMTSSFAPINVQLDGFTGCSNGERIGGSVGDTSKEGPRINVRNKYGAISLFAK